MGEVERMREGIIVSHHYQLKAAEPRLPPPSTSISECKSARRKGEAQPGMVLQGIILVVR